MRILITGGDHTGKDSLATSLVRVSQGQLVYSEASSLKFAELVPAWNDGRDIVEWWEHRREHRKEWIREFDRLRKVRRPAIFATHLFSIGESIVTGIRFTSELIDLLTTDLRPHVIIWCRYSDRHQGGLDALTLNLTTQLASTRGIPVLHVWGPESADRVWNLIRHLEES